MCTSENSGTGSWLREVISQVLVAKDLRSALKEVSVAVVGRYPGVKIWFARRCGRRWSYLTGAGPEAMIEPVKIECTGEYAAFIQDETGACERDFELLQALFRVTVLLFAFEE